MRSPFSERTYRPIAIDCLGAKPWSAARLRLTSEERTYPGEGIGRFDREVGTGNQPNAMIEERAPTVGARAALETETRLGHRGIAGTVSRLHRGDDAELSEASDIRVVDDLRVLDAEYGIREGRAKLRVRVKCHSISG